MCFTFSFISNCPYLIFETTFDSTCIQGSRTNSWRQNDYPWKFPMSLLTQKPLKNTSQILFKVSSFNLTVEHIQLHTFCFWHSLWLPMDEEQYNKILARKWLPMKICIFTCTVVKTMLKKYAFTAPTL